MAIPDDRDPAPRARLHQLIDALPESLVPLLAAYLEEVVKNLEEADETAETDEA